MTNRLIVPNIRLPKLTYEAIEEIRWRERKASKSECARWLLSRAFPDVLDISDELLWRVHVEGVTDNKMSVELPPKLYEQVEEFRQQRKIPSRAEAIRALLRYAIDQYSRDQERRPRKP